MVGLMAQSIPSVPIPPPGICHFVLEKLQMPTVGPGVHTKTHSIFEARTSLQKRKDRILVKDLISNK